jgi:hypothetical protein
MKAYRMIWPAASASVWLFLSGVANASLENGPNIGFGLSGHGDFLGTTVTDPGVAFSRTAQLQPNAKSSTPRGETAKPGSDKANVLAPMALNSFSNVPDKISTAVVIDSKGSPVGAVRKVEMDAKGKPIRVEIALLGSQQIVALNSSDLSYDAAKNVLTAGLENSQIVGLPVIPQN